MQIIKKQFEQQKKLFLNFYGSSWDEGHDFSYIQFGCCLVTGLNCLANLAGVTFDFILPAIFSSKFNSISEEISSFERIKNAFSKIYVFFALISILHFTLVVIFLEDKPPNPPSRAEQVRNVDHEAKEDLKKKFAFVSKPDFIFLAIAMGTMMAMNYVVEILLNQLILDAFKDNYNALTVVGVMSLLPGMPGILISAHIVDKFKNHQLIIRLLYSTTVLSFMLMNTAILWNNLSLLYFSAFLYGLLRHCIFPIGVDSAVEMTYPVQEGPIVAFITFLSKLIEIVLMYTSSMLLEQSETWAVIYLTAILTIGLLCLLFSRIHMERSKIEFKHKMLSDGNAVTPWLISRISSVWKKCKMF